MNTYHAHRGPRHLSKCLLGVLHKIGASSMRGNSVFSMFCLAILFLTQVSNAQQIQPVRSILQKCFGPNCQSAANDFGYDKDGAKIIAVGPVMDPVPSLAPALPPVASSAPKAMEGWRDRKTSRQAILEGVDKALAAGTITDDQAKLIRKASKRPRMMAQIEQLIVDKAEAEGYALPMDANGEVIMSAVDWAAIADFITKIAPFIFKLIELFM